MEECALYKTSSGNIPLGSIDLAAIAGMGYINECDKRVKRQTPLYFAAHLTSIHTVCGYATMPCARRHWLVCYSSYKTDNILGSVL